MVRKLLKDKNPMLIMLQETKLKEFGPSIIRSLGCGSPFESIFSPALGSAGGLFSAWNPNCFEVSDKLIFPRFTAILGKFKSNQFVCGFVNIYGPSVDSEKEAFYAELALFLKEHRIPWCVGGDFNAYLSRDEKKGLAFNPTSMLVFRNFLQDVGLVDIPLSGGSYTWSNNRDPATFVRLDRFLIDPEFLLRFKNISQILLPRSLSDHNAVQLSEEAINWGPRPFKLYNYLLDDDDLVKTIKNKFAYQKNTNKRSGILSILKGSKEAIKSWASANLTLPRDRIPVIENEIHQIELDLQQGNNSDEDWNHLLALRKELSDCFRNEERIWLQNSRLKWFKDGDRNTRFFHISASYRKKNNQMLAVALGDKVISNPEDIKKTVHDFFSAAYNRSSTLEVDNINLDFSHLSQDQRIRLERPFSEEEVWEALANTDSSRAPGPDGFNMGFFKKFWPELKDDLMKFFVNFFHEKEWESGINHSFIALIPKKAGSISLEDYRPISLVGGIYKILSKVLSRRLRECIASVISNSQYAFIPGRNILDCAFIANEGINYIQKQGLKGVAFKIDFQRAFDSIDWNFLLQVLKEMGFGKRWCSWIFKCISSATISVLVNGVPTPHFSLARGLRQGCSLSPLLFNIVGEAFHLMLDKGVSKGLFSGFQIGKENPLYLSHLQFADDLIILCGASIGEIRNVKRTLRVFEIASGLHLNLSKSHLFGININSVLIENWASSIGCSAGNLPTMYLGLPLGNNRNSTALWDPVVSKFDASLANWKANNLSISGRLVLIKSVLSALPIYYMSLFKMPASIVQKLNSRMANFLWGETGSSKKIHWLNWQQVCKPLSSGGLGIRNLATQNRVLLSKWAWKFAYERESLWKRTICCTNNLSTLDIIPNPICGRFSNWIWKDVVKNFFMNDDIGCKLRNNLKIHMGDGHSIAFWHDTWIGEAPLQVNFPRIYALSSNKPGKVAEFGSKTTSGWVWNISLRRRIFDWELEQWNSLLNLLNSYKSAGADFDCLIWGDSIDGTFSVREGYKLIAENSPSDSFWAKHVWLGLSPPKVECFIWQALWCRIPVRDELRKRGLSIIQDSLCPLCRKSTESTSHLLLHCNVTWLIWMRFAKFWNIHLVIPGDLASALILWQSACPVSDVNSIWRFIPAVILWSIWLMRNDLIFRQGNLDFTHLFFISKVRLTTWYKAKFPGSGASFDDLISNPALADVAYNSRSKPSTPTKWSPPPFGFVKINVDGAMTRNGNAGGIGGLFRNSDGKTIFSFSESIGPGPPILAELSAIKFGLHLQQALVECCNLRPIVECDCQLALNWIANPTSCPPFFSKLVHDIFDLGQFSSCSFRFVPRVLNIEADRLAKAGIG
ncbi:hypothetical protein HRI_003669300 [Hibiscus trionum]|uniref:Reverse transcriptase domain-containing protein n=1 Tax=Hibiscus trionum TaxID=183268 RepID=A0A9W7IRA1_HIBTR|nr:hypothetical protein HRI_003669300 [Hibiscus trionum]